MKERTKAYVEKLNGEKAAAVAALEEQVRFANLEGGVEVRGRDKVVELHCAVPSQLRG